MKWRRKNPSFQHDTCQVNMMLSETRIPGFKPTGLLVLECSKREGVRGMTGTVHVDRGVEKTSSQQQAHQYLQQHRQS